jgi:hypothetical protein
MPTPLDAKVTSAQSDVLLSGRCYLLASLSAMDETVRDSICGGLGVERQNKRAPGVFLKQPQIDLISNSAGSHGNRKIFVVDKEA